MIYLHVLHSIISLNLYVAIIKTCILIFHCMYFNALYEPVMNKPIHIESKIFRLQLFAPCVTSCILGVANFFFIVSVSPPTKAIVYGSTQIR